MRLFSLLEIHLCAAAAETAACRGVGPRRARNAPTAAAAALAGQALLIFKALLTEPRLT
jgi:hypothetical protein